jgi:hypothetical protein
MKIYVYRWQNGGYFSSGEEFDIENIYTERNHQYLVTKGENTYSIGVMNYICTQFSTYKKLTDEQIKKLINGMSAGAKKNNYRYLLRKC